MSSSLESLTSRCAPTVHRIHQVRKLQDRKTIISLHSIYQKTCRRQMCAVVDSSSTIGDIQMCRSGGVRSQRPTRTMFDGRHHLERGLRHKLGQRGKTHHVQKCQGLTDWFLVSESVGVGEKLFLVAGGAFSVWCIPGTSGPRTCDRHVIYGSRFFCVGTTLCVNRRSLRQQHVCDVLCCARWSNSILNQ